MIYKHDFESVESFLDYLRNAPKCWGDSTTRAPDPWNGNVTFRQACNLLEFGWPDGRKMMSQVEAAEIANPVVAPMETQVFDIVGQRLDLPSYLAGDPECMVSTVIQPRETKIVRIVVAGGARAGHKSRPLMNRGGAILSYIDALEIAGYSTELVWNNISDAANERFECNVVIKKAGEPVDIDRLAFAFVNPAMQRRLCFRVKETIPEMKRNFSFGYGSTQYDVRPDGADCFVPMPKTTVALKSKETALKHVAQYFENF